MNTGSSAIVLACVDGRAHGAISTFMKQRFGTSSVDMITELGLDNVLSKGDYAVSESIKEKVRVCIDMRHSKALVIAGHDGCMENPVTRDQHIAQIKKATELVEVWNTGIPVLGVWVNDKGQVEQVAG